MATQFTTWMLEGEDWDDVSEIAWGSFGLWWNGELGEMGAPVRPRIMRFQAKRPHVQLYVKLVIKESVTID